MSGARALLLLTQAWLAIAFVCAVPGAVWIARRDPWPIVLVPFALGAAAFARVRLREAARWRPIASDPAEEHRDRGSYRDGAEVVALEDRTAERVAAHLGRAKMLLGAPIAVMAIAEIALAVRGELVPGVVLLPLSAFAQIGAIAVVFAVAIARWTLQEAAVPLLVLVWFALVPSGAALTTTWDTVRCDHGGVAECMRAGEAHARRSDPDARDRALTLFEKACALGDGCVRGAEIAGNREEYAQRAAALRAKACDQRARDACADLGLAYMHGRGVPRDFERAREHLTFACDLGSMPACANLGLLYDNGDGVAVDKTRARQLYDEACDKEVGAACNNIGVMLEQDDPTAAAAAYDRGCRFGSARACMNLAELYAKGQGVPEDAQRAMSLLKKACDYGESSACPKKGRGP